jgi:NADPH-dependent 7-cyano-7-deazaguanine reductase QueF
MRLRKVIIKAGSTIEYSSRELLFLGKSGQPYRGSLYIHFKSIGETINLVDLKKYLTSLRDETLNAEDIAYTIYETINNNISTANLGVIVDLTARGGIQQRLSFGEQFEVVNKANIFQV